MIIQNAPLANPDKDSCLWPAVWQTLPCLIVQNRFPDYIFYLINKRKTWRGGAWWHDNQIGTQTAHRHSKASPFPKVAIPHRRKDTKDFIKASYAEFSLQLRKYQQGFATYVIAYDKGFERTILVRYIEALQELGKNDSIIIAPADLCCDYRYYCH